MLHLGCYFKSKFYLPHNVPRKWICSVSPLRMWICSFSPLRLQICSFSANLSLLLRFNLYSINFVKLTPQHSHNNLKHARSKHRRLAWGATTLAFPTSSSHVRLCPFVRNLTTCCPDLTGKSGRKDGFAIAMVSFEDHHAAAVLGATPWP